MGSVLGLVAALLIAPVPSVLGQEVYGTLIGVATDASGAVLPGVEVTVTNRASGRVTNSTTRDDGTYRAADLTPGRYSVRFEKPGFARYEAPDVMVLLGKTLKVDANMQVGNLEQTVQVTEAPPLIDTTSTAIAHNVTDEEFDRLPKARTFQGLALTQPSVNTGVVEQGFQVNGASAAENNFVIDGVSTNSVVDGSARQDAVFEYLQEVQVKTGGLEAEYGGALGGVISAVTKSGGNAFHGELHYYLFGSPFNAAPVKRLNLDPVDDVTTRYLQDPKGKVYNNEVGGSLGGPIIKNKLFFFTSFSPRFQSQERPYRFDNGAGSSTVEESDTTFMNWFSKVSFDPTSRIRMNFTYLYTPTSAEGTLLRYNGSCPSCYTASEEAFAPNRVRGYFQPESSYTGTVDVTLSNTTLLNVRAGRYWLNYKDTGISPVYAVEWRTPSTNLPFSIPADLQRPSLAYNTPRVERFNYDVTTRTYVQADFSQFIHAAGQHNLKFGVGTQKNVNRVFSEYPGGAYTFLFWDTAFRGTKGQYGYYEVHEIGTQGSTGGNITNLFIQDQWRVHPRLTLSLGLRTERETIPSFARNVQDYAFRFNFDQKVAPRLGASFDLFGDGRVKIYGAWGRYYDWTKYELSRGTFGGEYWRVHYRTLDTLDVFNLTPRNLPGTDLWGGSLGYRDRRLPGFEYLDPDIKPMSSDLTNVGIEYQITPQTVFAGRYVHNNLRRTIEDLGALDANGNEQYYYANPGEGLATLAPVSGATEPFPMPKAKRQYDAMELQMTRRFSRSWFGQISYVYSRLYGNYAGIQSSDEIRPPSLGGVFGPSQSAFGVLARPGGNVNRYWDLDEAMWDAQGNLGLLGRLPTDRPHVLKLYGSYEKNWGTTHATNIGGFFRASSGTPATTQVISVNHIPVYVNGRGDLGRTPFFTNTDLMVSHDIKFGEVKRLRFEFNMLNLFNQKIAQFIFDRVNREGREESAGINLSDTDLAQGFDYRALLAQTSAGQAAYDPRFGMEDLFATGFQGRFLVKFIF
jgi:hypothetical protein